MMLNRIREREQTISKHDIKINIIKGNEINILINDIALSSEIVHF